MLMVRERESHPTNEKYANGSVGARVRLMVRGGSLPVRGSKVIEWEYNDNICVCGKKKRRYMYFSSANAMTG